MNMYSARNIHSIIVVCVVNLDVAGFGLCAFQSLSSSSVITMWQELRPIVHKCGRKIYTIMKLET